MLPDPLKLSVNSSDANLSDWRLTDVAPGSSTRILANATFSPSGSGEGKFRIAHTETNESSPLGSIRTLIRMDAACYGSTVPIERGVASVQLVIVRPKMTDLTSATMTYMVKGFVSSLFASGIEATYDTLKAALDGAYLDRVLSGEP